VIIMITNTAPKVSGIAATTTIPTLHPRLSRLTSITTQTAIANLTINSLTAELILTA
jgi:hypothetical protein